MSELGGLTGGEPVKINNEFALVHLELDRDANGVRLKITSARTGRIAYLDPLALEALTWMPTEEILRHLQTPFGPEEEDLSIFGDREDS